MAEFDALRTGTISGARAAQIDQGLRAHMNKVYGMMSVGMLLTFAAAWAISGLAVVETPEGQALTALGTAIYASPLRWVVMLAPLAFVFGLSFGINKLSAAAANLVFYLFAAVMGVSLSSIFLVFTGESIISTFLVTSIAFAALSLYGYTTKKDLSGMGTFLFMGLIGLLVAMVVNIFLASSALAFAISVIGVLIFAGLTAYDTQSIKNEYVAHAAHGDQEWLGKSAIMGALRLYLDFINMFMFLLQFMGNRE
jgi:FtsH-binding integral membrane protein